MAVPHDVADFVGEHQGQIETFAIRHQQLLNFNTLCAAVRDTSFVLTRGHGFGFRAVA
jgi:hypothetical protein